MPRVIIPSPLRKYTNNQREIIVDGNNLKETMQHLLRQYPGLNTIINDSALFSIFINSKVIRTRTEKWNKLSMNNDDEITLIIPIAGG